MAYYNYGGTAASWGGYPGYGYAAGKGGNAYPSYNTSIAGAGFGAPGAYPSPNLGSTFGGIKGGKGFNPHHAGSTFGRGQTSMCGTYKVEIKQSDMSAEMQQDAIEITRKALDKWGTEKTSNEKETASMIKGDFDKKYDGDWHCIIGRNFGSLVTSESRHFIYFYMGPKNILLFGTGCNIATLSKMLYNGSASIIAGAGATREEVF